jgi:GTPase SAR1 family protein
MTYGSAIPARIDSVRQRTIAVLENLAEKARAYQLPAPPAALEGYRSRLIANSYQVLVIGEAKRGKSSFVNALLGRAVLPTDVDVATSQVFRISRAEREAYRIRFEDESRRDIAFADLSGYGSQVVADAEGMPRLNQIIRWIEVDIPTHFLPSGVSILDTPGLGSLYSAHARITQRFVPLADAVIFVLDSSQPIIQAELDFIKTILEVTPHIFFIQTKIDLYRREQWQALLRRNQEILREQFGTRLTDTRVWPISSANLMQAVQTDDDDLLGVSRYKQLWAVLQVFLFHVAGWDRSAKAISAAEDYHNVARKTLAGRLTAVNEESDQKRAEIQQRIAQRKRRFDSEWSQSGQKQEELMENVRRIAGAGKGMILQALHQGNEIELTTRNKIEGLKSFDEAVQFSNSMDGQVVRAYIDIWSSVRQLALHQCNELLTQLLAIANSLSFPDEPGSTNVAVRYAHALKVKGDWASFFEEANREGGWVSTVFEIFLPSQVAKLASLCWAGIRAIFGFKNRQLEAAKQDLHSHLNEVLQSVREQFLGVDLAFGYRSRVDAYFDSLVSAVSEQVQKIAKDKSAEAQVELDRLAEEAKLDEQERRTKVDLAQQQLADWDAISQSIKEIVSDLKILEQSLELFSI